MPSEMVPGEIGDAREMMLSHITPREMMPSDMTDAPSVAGNDPLDSSLRFVVLYHQLPPAQGRSPHWDLMFQQGDRLRTWSVVELPQPDGPASTAIMLPPHRLAYLDYEGPVSGDRGDVRRIDRGMLQWLTDTPRRVVIRIRGEQLQGQLTLQRLSDRDSAEDRDAVWMMWLSESGACERVSDASW